MYENERGPRGLYSKLSLGGGIILSRPTALSSAGYDEVGVSFRLTRITRRLLYFVDSCRMLPQASHDRCQNRVRNRNFLTRLHQLEPDELVSRAHRVSSPPLKEIENILADDR